MIDFLTYRWHLRKATRNLCKTRRYYNRLIESANREHKSLERVRELEDEARHYVHEAEIRRQEVISTRLCATARLLNLEVPSFKDEGMWYEPDQFCSRYTLTNKGITTERRAIREEQVARGRYLKVAFWVLTSLIAAIATIWRMFK